MIPARHRWLAGAVLVGLGFLLSPDALPVYDGIGAPDEPYRYVARPEGAPVTADATTAAATTPVKAGTGTNGLSVATREVGPQFSLYLPPAAMAGSGPTIEVEATPVAPSRQPPGGHIDGNVYVVRLISAGPVTLTDKAAVAALYLRATTAAQPPPLMHYRTDSAQPWKPLKTARGGQDIYVSSFAGAGEYALAFRNAKKDGGFPLLPVLLGGAVAALVAVVLIVRLRAAGDGGA